MTDKYTEHDTTTDCEDCETRIRADERNKVIAEIRVGLGRFQEFEYETNEDYFCIKYYKADKVMNLLTKVSKGGKNEIRQGQKD